MTGATRIYLPFWLGVIVTALVFVIGLGIVVYGARRVSRGLGNAGRVTAQGRLVSSRDISEGRYARRFGVKTMAAAIVGAVVFTWPWSSMRYHEYRQVAGTVAAVNVRMLADGKATSQVYAVQITGAGVYRCDDTRCSLLKPGDTISLWCKTGWQWFGTAGDVCAFGKSSEAP